MSSPVRLAILALVAALILPAAAGAASKTKTPPEPKLTVSKAKLAAAFTCNPGTDPAKKTPIMFVTGTGVPGPAAYALGKPAFDDYGAPVCSVDYPAATTGDLQTAVQYLVYGIREMNKRFDRQIAILGISQGGLLPRVALTYWPSLRKMVSDVVAAAGPQHGTDVPAIMACAKFKLKCVPAAFQQAARSNFIKALDSKKHDEAPGPTSWTAVWSTSDETVQPTGGSKPASKLKGASNIVIQSVCPGRQTSHVGTIVDSVTFALAIDAVAHKGKGSKGAGKASRLPGDVCEHPYAPGLDEKLITPLLGTLAHDELSDPNITMEQAAAAMYPGQPTVSKEPALKSWMKR
jgi:hypothetical protein